MNRLQKMKENRKKGFTLIEMIVVLVILALLASILIPSLLGYIDEAKQRQLTIDANAAFTAAQSLADEAYAFDKTDLKTEVTNDRIVKLADISDPFTVKVGYKGTTGKDRYKISMFKYTDTKRGKTLYLTTDGNWVPDEPMEYKEVSEFND